LQNEIRLHGSEPAQVQRWIDCARAAAEAIGDIAVVTQVRPGEDLLVTLGVCHRDSERERAAEHVIGESYQRGQGLPGRVWQTERGILLVDVDDDALAEAALNHSNRYIREVGIRSLMLVPLYEGTRVVGTLGVARDPGGTPYTEADFDRLVDLAKI
jgi:GAF domain-containing protein